MKLTVAPLAGVALAAFALSGCVSNTTSEAGALTVSSSADECKVSADTAESGNISFEVTNDGDKVTEFYVLGSDGLRIVGEVENIAPGITRNLTVQAQPGEYFTACKPGMVGDDVDKNAFTVTGKAIEIDPEDAKAVETAVANYVSYTQAQVAELVPNVQEFADAYKAGDDAKARELFPIARINYERIEPTAEQFGDLDPKIDYRKPGAEAEGLEFTGFHRIEMDLWLDEAMKNYPDEKVTALDEAGRAKVGDQLVADVKALYEKVHADDFALSLGDITNGAIGLLDEVAAPDGKLPGEENEFAHTDLYDFYANVEGAEVAYLNVRDIAEAKGEDGKKLVADLDQQFKAMKDLLATYGDYDQGFVFYDTVKQPQRNELGAALNALSEPMSKLTHTVLGVDAE
ncbi:iron uptake system protein EfeO [Nocardioides yefusunii]|uniref:Iron uptake system protein EfeO n=1 Tax=Nocardioides yefusunii TaxID=2500546 RepID=A0ABW1QY71_9ACTN|nr:iron uptake system protein EfeO [Nocardioides yefusunii]